MKIKRCLLSLLIPVLLPAFLGACAAPEKPPAPAPGPVTRAPPRPVPQPAPPTVEWQDLALAPGNWSYNEREGRSEAWFGASDPSFIIRCDRQSGQIQLLRPGVTAGNTMVVRTSEAMRALPLAVATDATATPYASLGASDSMLDNIAFSRGRFSVETAGTPMLVIPTWAEPAKVIEDCRN